MPSRWRSRINERSNSERPHHRQQQRRHRRVVTGERQLLLLELHPHPPASQGADQGAQVIQVAGEAVHRVHQHGVAVPDERQHRLQLPPGGVAARGARPGATASS